MGTGPTARGDGVILALDLGTWTGVARGVAGEHAALETWRMPAGGHDEIGTFMAAFIDYLTPALVGVESLVFEAPYIPRDMHPNVVRRSYGMAAVCEGLASQRSIDVFECNIMTLKAQFAGSGKASKADMIFAAKRRGFSPENEHEADAAACFWWTVCNLHRGESILSRYDPLFVARG